MMLKRHLLGTFGAILVLIFILMGVYAPLLASSKPLVISYDNTLYFPLFRYLFFQGFYTKPLDLFFNLLMFTLPLAILFWKKPKVLIGIGLLQIVLFFAVLYFGVKDPASDRELSLAKQARYAEIDESSNSYLPKAIPLGWSTELKSMNGYAKLNEVIRYILRRDQNMRLKRILKRDHVPTLFAKDQEHTIEKIARLKSYLKEHEEAYFKAYFALESLPYNPAIANQEEIKLEQNEIRKYQLQQSELNILEEKNLWLEAQADKVSWMVMPLIRPFHWEDDAGGEQGLNQYLPWWDLTRVNRKDLVAALIFGVRISLVVGFLAVGLSLLIGIPIGAYAGYYGGIFDIFVSRLIEVWESMPTFFMLLLVISMMQSKSIFIVISVIGIFGWTGFSRYIRGEFFKQRNLGYVESCQSIGYPDRRIIFRHILPNAIPPILTLLPFAIMGAITAEAGLSFLGLGEEGSCSWGVLMDEGRSAFPGEAYLLWPPAIFLTILLISIALIGDALRDYLDPKTS